MYSLCTKSSTINMNIKEKLNLNAYNRKYSLPNTSLLRYLYITYKPFIAGLKIADRSFRTRLAIKF